MTATNGWPGKPGVPRLEGKMRHDLVDRLRCGVATYDDMDDAAARMEAQEAEIARLRAAINDALTAPWPDPVLNSTWHQEPIGPNETPEEAIKRLVGVRAEWAVYKNNCENPVIAELRAALATARREGMAEAADLCDDLPDHQGGICAIAIRMMIDEEDKKAATMRAAAKEDREP